ncbi:hypothetical protein NSK_007809 [Nannochloropsis salina CCMP1776]|uniref:Dihydrodipicolinate synthase family protein n=1 Tax=Nannochloropsis salina CCMP1776 TaxID=1027361 RepID=A0A4D9CQR4_9STRA|nr:hypothetical protein NSK_007809 [Nannochloropsis salina CCMP1776]|eukprot:TFJ80854.1 hypothetical protein NSK_007809 [Nannochloropsis salina CCMP1776]
MRGIFAPVLTPFLPSGAPDITRFLWHARWLLSNDVNLAIFGTNSEANSMTTSEKLTLLHTLVEEGKADPNRLMPGTGACAVGDAVTLSKASVRLGCGGVLVLPPFYYKGVGDEGVFRYYAHLIEQVADERLRVYLYHIPQVSGVGISHSLIERLMKAYPGIIAGIKDSAGDWKHTASLITHFGKGLVTEGSGAYLRVFAGSEAFLLRTLRAGGQGCISATANVNPARIVELYHQHETSQADRLQDACQRLREAFPPHALIPSMKATIAHFTQDKGWERVRPPLVELEEEEKESLLRRLHELKFKMPDPGAC